MFLKCLDINGFKSFADKTHIDFADGITSLLGPNGCGKSNIVDSIKWVLGEQSTKTLRAGKMEDVIFNGTDTRAPLQFAEVALTIDNGEHKLMTDLAEIEIKRRVFRSGESEYYINKQRCLLKNIRELFFDTGIGKSAYSILEQGKIDQILSSKPEDRRYIFEEAAGISRFKKECEEAQKKIDRTNENIAQVNIRVNVEKRNYNSLQKQAEKAISYKELQNRQLDVDIQLQACKIRTYQNLKIVRSQQIEKNKVELERLRVEYENTNVSLEGEKQSVSAMNIRASEIQRAISRAEGGLSACDTKIRYLDASYHEKLKAKSEGEENMASLNETIARYQRELDEHEASLADNQEALDEAESQLGRARSMIESDQKRIEDQNNLIYSEEANVLSCEKRIEELGEELKGVIENLALELDEKMKDEFSYARRKKCDDELSALIDSLLRRLDSKLAFYRSLPDGTDPSTIIESDLDGIFALANQIKNAYLAYKASIPPFIDSLLAPEGLLTRKRAISDEEEKLRKAMEASRKKIAQARETIAELTEEVEGLRVTAESMSQNVASIKARLDGSKELISNVRRSIEENTAALFVAENNVNDAIRRIDELDGNIREAEQEKRELNATIEIYRKDLQGVMQELNECNGKIETMQKQREHYLELINTLKSESEKAELLIGTTDDSINQVYQYFYSTYSRSLNEYNDRIESMEELPDERLLQNELDEIRKQLGEIGNNVNLMAVDEFEEVKERYEFYTKQLDDLEKAKGDLEKVLTEITQKSEELFLATYKQISDNFQSMFRRLFNGGKAEITLADEENVLTSGIEIFAQPPGKKLINLTLLSGGERSMTAVALLFATYMVKPSPFCVLDEIDAALDDKNIGYFLSVLQDFAQTSQFIIITHNTHTVMGSTSLLGVSQMEAGVSQTVTYKLGNVAGEPVIFDEDNQMVEFDSEGRAKKSSKT